MCQRIQMRQYASSPRKEKSEHERSEKRDYKGLQRAQVALQVWPAHQPGCSPEETSARGPIGSLIKQEEREDNSYQICQRV